MSKQREEENEPEYIDQHNASGFCFDMSCPCHEDQTYIQDLNQYVLHGLASPEDANKIYKGQTVW